MKRCIAVAFCYVWLNPTLATASVVDPYLQHFTCSVPRNVQRFGAYAAVLTVGLRYYRSDIAVRLLWIRLCPLRPAFGYGLACPSVGPVLNLLYH